MANPWRMEHWNYSGLPPVERYDAAVDRANELLTALTEKDAELRRAYDGWQAADDVFTQHAIQCPQCQNAAIRAGGGTVRDDVIVAGIQAVIALVESGRADDVTHVARLLKGVLATRVSGGR